VRVDPDDTDRRTDTIGLLQAADHPDGGSAVASDHQRSGSAAAGIRDERRRLGAEPSDVQRDRPVLPLLVRQDGFDRRRDVVPRGDQPLAQPGFEKRAGTAAESGLAFVVAVGHDHRLEAHRGGLLAPAATEDRGPRPHDRGTRTEPEL
jgi:hypothetical protein